MSQKFTVRNVLSSYMNLFEPKPTPGDNPQLKYSCCLILDKVEDKDQITKLQAAIKAVATEKFGKKRGLKNPLRDGDEERDDDPVFRGKMFLNVSSKKAPQVVDRQLRPVGEDEAFSGCKVNASIALYAFEVPANKGVGAGLNNVQIVNSDMPRLDGSTSAEDDFEKLDDDDDDDDELD